jgi:predicted metal-binding membrane protein
MWVVMMMAMMLPSLVPMLLCYILLLFAGNQLTPWKARRLLYCRHTPVYALTACELGGNLEVAIETTE